MNFDGGYWESFFQNNKNFEWYAEYQQIKDLLSADIRKNERVLIVGCGNSELGYHIMLNIKPESVVNLDNNKSVVAEMAEKHKNEKNLSYVCGDIFDLSKNFDKESFDVVVDKGTIDSILISNSKECLQKAKTICEQVSRVLKKEGKFLCLTYAQDFVLSSLLQGIDENFYASAWLPTFIDYPSMENANFYQLDQSSLTIMNYLPLWYSKSVKHENTQNHKFHLTDDNSLDLIESEDGKQRDILASLIFQQQSFYYLQYILQCEKYDKSASQVYRTVINQGEYIRLHYFVVMLKQPNYLNLTKELSDTDNCSNKTVFCYIPHSVLSSDIIFQYDAGFVEHCYKLGYNYTVYFSLEKQLKYQTLANKDSVDIEKFYIDRAANIAKIFVPLREVQKKTNYRVVGCVEEYVDSQVVYRDYLEGDSGPEVFVIERTHVESETRRRQIVFSTQLHCVQTDLRLNCEEEEEDDDSFIGYYSMVAFAMVNLVDCKNLSVLLIGLGGGGLLRTFLNTDLLRKITSVEISQKIVDIAEEYFELKTLSFPFESEVVVADGIEFIKRSQKKGNKEYDVLIVDVNNTMGEDIICPHEKFINDGGLITACRDIVSKQVLFNCVFNNEKQEAAFLEILKNYFKYIMKVYSSVDDNFILVCSNLAFNSDNYRIFSKVCGDSAFEQLNEENAKMNFGSILYSFI